jgi:hypothetical protein
MFRRSSLRRSTGTSSLPIFKALFGELRALGYIAGQNLIVERYCGEGRTAHYAELASEVVRQQPDVVFADSTRMVRYFKEATTTIPNVGDMAALSVTALAFSYTVQGLLFVFFRRCADFLR